MAQKRSTRTSKISSRKKHKYPIEAEYAAAGSWEVSTEAVTDTSGNSYDLFYPTNLGENGFKHPILTWGNGTWATPSKYPGVLNQLASWGFVIVASTSQSTGSGSEMLAGAIYMVIQSQTKGSSFYGKLDTTRVAALGHSQGAGGSVNATTNSGGLITTTVPICLPDALLSMNNMFDVTKLSNPVFLLGSSNDVFAPPSTLAGYYAKIPGGAAMAVLKGADHNVIQDTGGMFLGYLTAWMMYRMQGDEVARGAFVGTLPEIEAETTNWQNQAIKDLP